MTYLVGEAEGREATTVGFGVGIVGVANEWYKHRGRKRG